MTAGASIVLLEVTDGRVPAPLPAGVELPMPHERWDRDAGQCLFREAPVPVYVDAQFRQWWMANRLEASRRGFSVRSENGLWYLAQRLKVHADGRKTLTPWGQSRLSVLTGVPVELEKEAPLPELPDGLEEKLFEYQREPARQLFRALTEGPNEWGFSGAWCCDDMGTGKTFTGLAAAIATGKNVLVVCPKSVKTAWRNAAGGHFRFELLHEPANYEAMIQGRHKLVKIVTENGRKFYRWQANPAETVIIFDECHKMKNAGTKAQALGLAAVTQGFSILCLSGTIATAPTHLRFAGRVVGLHTGHNGRTPYDEFLVRHGCQRVGAEWQPAWGAMGRQFLAKINRVVFPKRGSRTSIADLGDRFPETQILCEAYDGADTAKITAAFREAQAVIDKLRDQGESEGRIKMMQASAYMQAWHESERIKIPAIADMVRQELEAGRSVAVFVNFTDTRQMLMEALKTRCAIYGGQNQDERDRCIAAFQADTEHVIVANITAGGVGVSLHDIRGERPRTAIILPTNQVVSLSQALGRVHRAGGKSRSRQVVFFAAGTIEEKICDATRAKIQNIDALNDGDMNPPEKF